MKIYAFALMAASILVLLPRTGSSFDDPGIEGLREMPSEVASITAADVETAFSAAAFGIGITIPSFFELDEVILNDGTGEPREFRFVGHVDEDGRFVTMPDENAVFVLVGGHTDASGTAFTVYATVETTPEFIAPGVTSTAYVSSHGTASALGGAMAAIISEIVGADEGGSGFVKHLAVVAIPTLPGSAWALPLALILASARVLWLRTRRI